MKTIRELHAAVIKTRDEFQYAHAMYVDARGSFREALAERCDLDCSEDHAVYEHEKGVEFCYPNEDANYTLEDLERMEEEEQL